MLKKDKTSLSKKISIKNEENHLEKNDITLDTQKSNETKNLTKESKKWFWWLFSIFKKNKINESPINTDSTFNNTIEGESNNESLNNVIEDVQTNNNNEWIWISKKQIGIQSNEESTTKKDNIESVFNETKFLIDSNDEITPDSTNVKAWFFSRLFGWWKKPIDTQSIRNFEWAIKWIKFFIDTQEWQKAKLWIEEIKLKEEKAFYSLVDKIDLEKEKSKQKSIYDKKIKSIEKLNDELFENERKYTEKKELEKFKIKFIQIRERLDELIWAKKNYEALDLINSFFDDNKDSPVIVKFYDKWKRIIQKNIEKQLRDDEKNSKKNAKAEALALIWERTNIIEWWSDEKSIHKKKKYLFRNLVEKFNIYKIINKKLEEKKLLDEVTILIESESEINEATKRKRLENIHVWLIKEIDNDKLLWYDFYAKILWKDKISGDTFWFSEDENSYKFFLWDATWHWVQAWLIVTLLSRLFHSFSRNNLLEKVVFEINNWLKQDLKSRNFITWIFFEVEKKSLHSIRYIWMWHEPILIYRKKTWEVEKLIAWWLAAWIRIMNDINQVKSRDIKLEDWDIVMLYSDWIVEARDINNQLLWVDWLASIFKRVCESSTNKVSLLYSNIIDEVKLYKWWNANFDDDASILMLKRNSQRDIIDRKSQYLKNLTIQEWLSKKNVKELEWKTKEEIWKELERIKREKQVKLILDNLEKLLVTWEILKLKQESIRYIKEWFIHKKINWYLKKAIANERKYKIDLKEQKMKTKYKVLKELLKKWDYNTVIRESNEIISNDWNITI